jgi:hypothetical protein
MRERKAQTLEMAPGGEIRHHRGHGTGGEPVVFLKTLGDHRQELVAVDEMAALVDDDHTVGVAVERDADIGPHFPHFPAQFLGRGRAAIAVDIDAVWFDPDRNHLGAELPQAFRHHPVGRTMGAVDHHAQTLEAHGPRQRALGELDVTVVHAIDALGAPELLALGQLLGKVGIDERLDLVLDLVGVLVAVGAEQRCRCRQGLCEAEIITPRSQRIERVSMATAGVGIGPVWNTSMPTEVKPATSAVSII